VRMPTTYLGYPSSSVALDAPQWLHEHILEYADAYFAFTFEDKKNGASLMQKAKIDAQNTSLRLSGYLATE